MPVSPPPEGLRLGVGYRCKALTSVQTLWVVAMGPAATAPDEVLAPTRRAGSFARTPWVGTTIPAVVGISTLTGVPVGMFLAKVRFNLPFVPSQENCATAELGMDDETRPFTTGDRLEKCGSSRYTTSSDDSCMVKTNEKFKPVACPARAGNANTNRDVLVNEPTGWVTRNGVATTGPAAAFVAIVKDDSFDLIPFGGITNVDPSGMVTSTHVCAGIVLLTVKIKECDADIHDADGRK